MEEKRVAIITGASKGIGKATAYEIAKNGINVSLIARSFSKIKKISKDIKDKYNVETIAIKTDVGNSSEVKKAVEEVIKKFGRIDYLINFAGYPLIIELWKKKVHELDEDSILKIFNVDFMGSFRMVRECLPHMINQRYGVIINISSIPSLSGDVEGAAYTFSKSAVIALTKNIARTYGIYNIRAYTIALGSIMTYGTYNQLSKSERKMLAEETSLKRWGRPEEIAKLVCSLISDSFSFVTGQTIIADGGVIIY
jgi:3-oxoacyl-[acyl-carrier protein] reductase